MQELTPLTTKSIVIRSAGSVTTEADRVAGVAGKARTVRLPQVRSAARSQQRQEAGRKKAAKTMSRTGT